MEKLNLSQLNVQLIGNVLLLLLLEIYTASLLMIKILVAHIPDLYFSDRINRECPPMLS